MAPAPATRRTITSIPTTRPILDAVDCPCLKLKKGIPVNAGVVVGPAFVLEEGVRVGAQQRFIKTRTKEAAQRELERFEKGLALAHKDAEEEQSRLAEEVKGEV